MTEKKRCVTCRYWSEMLAMAGGDLPGVAAMCLSKDSPHRDKYTNSTTTCSAWADGYLGAIDSPGFDGTEYSDESP